MSDIQSESSRSSLWTTGLGIRFFIDMENKVTTTGINPRVSYTAGGKFARNGSAMTIVTLKSILDRCASNEFKNSPKSAAAASATEPFSKPPPLTSHTFWNTFQRPSPNAAVAPLTPFPGKSSAAKNPAWGRSSFQKLPSPLNPANSPGASSKLPANGGLPSSRPPTSPAPP